MHIKQITIQGFKSYKDQITFDPFSPKHNVIVGRNGSGKSNFFAAIRFVLSDAYQSLSKEERQALLHEGSGSATISAFVEIIFDNSDNRFPTGKPEVVLRRSIGLTMDEYALDGKSVTKSDVSSLLESAGFSRSNPYYIVPQGRVTSLTVAKDEDRLQLLKEIAGTRVYEQKRSESTKIMEETDAKRNKITEVLAYIQERLAELEQEKEELSEFQSLDRERRSLEYTIYAREQAETNEKLEELEENRRRDLLNSETVREQYAENEAKMNTLEDDCRDIKQELGLLEAEKSELLAETEQLLKRKAKLDLFVKDLEDGQLSEKEYTAKLEAQLAEVDQEIATAEQEISEITPQYEALRTKDEQLRAQVASIQFEQENLHRKQARLSRFTSKSERDVWLQSEIATIEANLAMQRLQLTTVQSEKSAAEEQLAERRRMIQAMKDKVSAQQNAHKQLAEKEMQLKQKRDEATEQRKKLWRAEAKLETVLHNCIEETRRARRVLSSSMDRNTGAGLDAVTKIAASLNLTGVYGPVFSLFDVDEKFRAAVEVAAGGSLFQVVVDNDITATKLLEVMNQEQSGRVTFIPMNRIKARTVSYPQANDAIPVIQRITFDERFRTVFEHVFGNVIVCPTLEVAASYAKSHNLTVVTLDGDRVDQRGALYGGYVDTRHSRLEAAKNLKTWQIKLEQEQARGQQIKQDIERLDQEITQILGELQLIEAKKKQLKLQEDSVGQETKLRNEEEVIKKMIAAKDKILSDMVSTGKSLEDQQTMYRKELESEPTHMLSAEEQEALLRNNQLIEQIKAQLNAMSASKTAMENRLNELKDQITNNLQRRRQEIASRRERSVIESSADDLKRRTKEQKTVTKKLAALSKRTSELERLIEEQQEHLLRCEQALEQARTTDMELAHTIRKQEKNLERHLLRKSLLQQRKEDCNANIRDLGVLPEDAFEKYANLSVNKLLSRLHRANEALQKYGHVNKKAFEQYGVFTKQRDQLTIRKSELDTSAGAIRNLIDSLDRRKNEAIERTFQQVAANFAEIFEALVPAGRGELVMVQKSVETQDMDLDDAETSDQHGSVERYSGVSIKVSFNSKSDEGLIMQQLSGGQKSLVALALIFAIQKCDPAPFYLFDEIDANLDAQYRTAVADMIHRLSENAQFITTTFRPELLAHADKFYGVTFQNKVSRIHGISGESAFGFVEQEQAQGGLFMMPT